jgi:hypothetical protein
MLYLTRRNFPDRLLVGDDLDALADLWFAWYDEVRAQAPSGGVGHHRIEGRLWAFPRHDGDRLERVLAGAVAASGVPGLEIDRPDPDTLAAATPFFDLHQPCTLAPLLACFAAPEFDGLPLLLRLSLHDWRGEPDDDLPLAGGTLVVCGQLAQGRLRLKAIWGAGLVEEHERLYEKARWNEEGLILRALDDPHRIPPVPATAPTFLGPRGPQRRQHWLLSRLFELPGQPKLAAFLGRAGFFAALLAGATAVLLGLRPRGFLLASAVGFATVSLGGLAYVVWKQARKVVDYHTHMRAGLKRLYSHSVRFIPVDLAAVGAWPDPHAAKYSSEIEALGGRHYFDLTHDPPPTGTSYIRSFVVAQEHTYVSLLLLYGTRNGFVMFPAKATVMATTYFDGGERLVSSNSGLGFRKKLNPRVIMRHFEGTEDPAALLARHRQEGQRLLGEGRRLAPLMGPEELLRRMESDHEESREILQRYGYWSWGDAVRQTFGLVRSEYRAEG